MFMVFNRGEELESDFWDSEHAKAGMLFVTWHAGIARLLVPDALGEVIPDMLGSAHAEMSIGPWPDRGVELAIELLFEDKSDHPFVIMLHIDQMDRMEPSPVRPGPWRLQVRTRQGLEGELALYTYERTVPTIELPDHLG